LHDLGGNAPRFCAECEAHADLGGALAHDVRHDAVDPDDTQHQRNGRRDGEQGHREGHLACRTIEDFLQGPHLRDGEIAVDCVNSTPHR
jgi:hypothetical protein